MGPRGPRGPRVPGSRDPGVPGSGGPRFPRPRNRIRLGRSLGRPVRRSITPSIARPITRSIARCTRPFDPGVGALTPKPKASEGGEKGKHLMGATRGGTPEGKETSACLVSYLSRCTRPFDPGVGTPTPKPEASEGGENGNNLKKKNLFPGPSVRDRVPGLKIVFASRSVDCSGCRRRPGARVVPRAPRSRKGRGRTVDSTKRTCLSSPMFI